jgi:molybdopterin molybdotransferase
MIRYSEALEIIARAVEPLAASDCPLDRLGNTATVGDIVSKIDVPGFANSAMDGFAVRSADIGPASDGNPVRLPVQGRVAAGGQPGEELRAGTAVEIMTGAPIPSGADAVIPVERVEQEPTDQETTQQIIIKKPVAAGANVRLPGEDFQQGDTLLRGGQLIRPHGIMGIAATGIDQVRTRPAPRVAVLTTGNELTASGAPDRAGLIRDANGPYLTACIQHLGATLSAHARVSDDPEALEKSIRVAQQNADMVLTTGGVSAGRFDNVPDVIVRLGGEVLFHKVAIRPGKPLLLARLAGGQLFLLSRHCACCRIYQPNAFMRHAPWKTSAKSRSCVFSARRALRLTKMGSYRRGCYPARSLSKSIRWSNQMAGRSCLKGLAPSLPVT